MEYDVESIITETENAHKKMKKTMMNSLIVVILAFIITVAVVMSLGIAFISVSIISLFGMMYFFPLITFYLGMAIIWRKKFSVQEKKE